MTCLGSRLGRHVWCQSAGDPPVPSSERVIVIETVTCLTCLRLAVLAARIRHERLQARIAALEAVPAIELPTFVTA